MSNAHPRPWHANSVFGPGPRCPFTREQRARFRFLLTLHHRAGRLTRTARDVAEALVRRLGADGQCDPAHVTLANDVAGSDRTVRRCLDALRGLGLVRWTRRLIRAGWRCEQTSNAYTLALTENPTSIAAKPCGGHSDRQTRNTKIYVSAAMVSDVSPAERAAAQAALARRRAVVEAALLTKGGKYPRPM